jgi:hypothetical protein
MEVEELEVRIPRCAKFVETKNSGRRRGVCICISNFRVDVS